MRPVRIRVSDRDRRIEWQLAFKADGGLHDVWRAQCWTNLLNGLRRLETRQRRDRGDRREEVRIRNHELLLNDAVVTQRGQAVRQNEAVVKDSEPGADYGLRAGVLTAGPGRPRDS